MCVLGLVVSLLFHTAPNATFNGYLVTLEVLGGVTFGLGMFALVSKLSLAERADLAAAGCGYPRQLMLLPAPTSQLVFLPMVYGLTVISLLWIAFAAILGQTPEAIWVPALGFSALLATIQAITWSTTSRPFVKIAVAIFWVVILAASAPTLLLEGISPAGLGVFFIGSTVLAAGVAFAGLAKGRSGSYSELAWPTWRRRNLDHAASFTSGKAAQDWLENRRNGSFHLIAGAMMSVSYAFPALTYSQALPFGWPLLVSPLACYLYPLVLSAWLGTFVGCSGSERDVLNQDRSVATFFAMRPLSDAALVASKLRMALRSATIGWLIMLPGPILFLCSQVSIDGTECSIAVALWRHMTLQFFTGLVLSVLILFFLTWRMNVSAMWLRLSRHLMLHGAIGIIAPISVVTFGIALIQHYSYRPDLVPELLVWITPVLGLLVMAKILATYFVVGRLRKFGLVPEATIQRWGTVCLVTGAVLLPLARIASPEWITTFQAAAGVFLILPTVRIPMAVLTLHANRHRGTMPLAVEVGVVNA